MGTSKKSKYQVTRNSYTLCQVKKMIGKKLIVLWNGLSMSNQDKIMAKAIKEQLLDPKNAKNLTFTATCNNGILSVMKNIDHYLAIISLSYKEIEKLNLTNICVIIVQYPKMTKQEIKQFLE